MFERGHGNINADDGFGPGKEGSITSPARNRSRKKVTYNFF